MTSHPKDLSDELIEVMASTDKICKSLHLPFQAGSTAVLKKMNRGYTKEQYLELVNKIKVAMPNIALTTDIIVGFPSETDEDFKDTLEIVKVVKYVSAFTFIYSKRTGTPAATMEQQVDEATIKIRFNQLLDVLNPISAQYMQAQVDKEFIILLEEVSKNDNNILSGRTDTGTLVHVQADPKDIGEFVKVRITNAKTHYLNAELVNEKELGV
ncbi:MAG: hypothetical protein ATN34_00585 [Epulopiscium sp. Nele67-Bin002]|nr:MAG: hypothetical protein ATN34_00585 [Epulopiscium sp. Nele67-Bin002]